MPPKSQVVEELGLAVQKAEIVERGIRGQQPSDIAKELKLSRQYVMRILDEALQDVTELLLEKAERLHLLNLLRIEGLIEVAYPLAKGGTKNPYYIDSEKTPDVPELLPPDRSWVSAVKDLIKLEFAWQEQLYARREESPESANEDIARPTIVAHDDMYILAQENMEADWMPEYAELELEDLLPEGAPKNASDPIPIIPGQKITEDHIQSLLAAAKHTTTEDGGGLDDDEDAVREDEARDSPTVI